MKSRLVMAAVLLVLLVSGSFVWGQQPPAMGQFSADTTMTASGQTHKGKVFVSKDRMRMESQVSGGQVGVIIVRMDKGVSWVLMPDQKMYMESTGFDQAELPKSEKELAEAATIKRLPNETVSGYPCEVTQYTYKDSSLGVMTVWMSKKLGYYVKTEIRNGSNLEFSSLLTNIKEGPPAASLFEVPAGFQKFAMPNIPGMPDGFKMPGTR